MTQHTPGPWELSRDAVPDWHTQITVYTEATGTRVATVFEREANAHLIAAAPELLAACEAALDRDDVADCELGDMLRAAIAKAKGSE